MSRSRKKPFIVLSKPWDKHKERGFRHRVKKACAEAAIDFDPDKDFEEMSLNHKKVEHDYGTKLGFDVPPDESDDTWVHKEYERLKRK
jgi:hypothetical protein